MENSYVPEFKSADSDTYKLYLYVEQILCETEARLRCIEKQLEIIKQIQKGGEEN